jgi:hypothetical protein
VPALPLPGTVGDRQTGRAEIDRVEAVIQKLDLAPYCVAAAITQSPLAPGRHSWTDSWRWRRCCRRPRRCRRSCRRNEQDAGVAAAVDRVGSACEKPPPPRELLVATML